MREIILDTETTGFDPSLGHRIIEIGCIELIDRKTLGRSFQVYVNPERDIPEDSLKVHGISSEFLKDKPVFSEVIDSFLDFIKDSTLIIHNADFDINFLNYELNTCGKDKLSYDRAKDTLHMARKEFPGQSNSLDALCDRFNIDKSKREKHGALIDVELLAEVYIKLCELSENKKQLLETVKKKHNDIVRERKEDRNFEIPLKDLENHQNFLKKLKAPLWPVA